MSSDDKFYQMLWDCATCGTKGLLGISHRHCPSCGNPQDETKRYFPEVGKEIEAENHKYVGRDWDCGYCSTPNSNLAVFCVNCGASKESGKQVELVDDSSVGIRKTDASSASGHVPPLPIPEPRPLQPPAPFSDPFVPLKNQRADVGGRQNQNPFEMSDRQFFWAKSVLAVIVLALTVLIALFFVKQDGEAKILSKDWHREIQIEQFMALRDSSWCDSMPFDAYAVSRSREVRSHKQVADGETCTTERHDNGDGSFSKNRVCHTNYRSEPVYDTMCRYTVNRWRRVSSSVSNGVYPQSPVWPTLKLVQGTGLGSQREGSRQELYGIALGLQDGKSDRCEFGLHDWERLESGAVMQVKIRALGGVVCSSLLPGKD